MLYPTSATSCALAVADNGQQLTCREVGDILGISDERVRVIEKRALKKLFAQAAELGVDALELAELLRRAARDAKRVATTESTQ